MFWRNWGWPARILSVLAVALVAAILFPVFARPRNGGHGPSCQSNLKQIGLGLAQYVQDYDEKFPLVSTGGSAYGWADALQPYLRSTQIYHCPQETDAAQTNPRKSGYTDYPFNGRISGKPMAEITEWATQVVSLDGRAHGEEYLTDARYSFRQIPSKWRQDEASPLYRHMGNANYLFADGHVKLFDPQEVKNIEQPRPVF